MGLVIIFIDKNSHTDFRIQVAFPVRALVEIRSSRIDKVLVHLIFHVLYQGHDVENSVIVVAAQTISSVTFLVSSIGALNRSGAQ